MTCTEKFTVASRRFASYDPSFVAAMKIHEYQAKAILAKHGVPVPRGEETTSPSEVADITTIHVDRDDPHRLPAEPQEGENPIEEFTRFYRARLDHADQAQALRAQFKNFTSLRNATENNTPLARDHAEFAGESSRFMSHDELVALEFRLDDLHARGQ